MSQLRWQRGELGKHKAKIEQIVVGLHFFQTHPDFLRAFDGDVRVRCVLDTRGVFHPKVYIFSSDDGCWDCIVGSANFTAGGFGTNTEAAMLVSSSDAGAESVKDGLDTILAEAWERAEALTTERIDAYEAMWRKNAPLRKSLGGRFGRSKKSKTGFDDDGGIDPAASPILMKSWPQFLAEVTQAPHHTLKGRLDVLAAVRGWFSKYRRFSAMPLEIRKRVGGCTSDADRKPIDWHWFGSMAGAGSFKELIGKLNSSHISDALDCIPANADVTKSHYDGFVQKFRAAFDGKRGGGPNAVATASRLLSMKRPDYFVCIDSKNRVELCKAFGLPKSVDLDAYWDSVCARIQQAAWWNASEPSSREATGVWRGRAAFLDSLFYDPT